jgi:hypothetical protein
MTAIDTVAGAGFRAPRRSRVLAAVGFIVVAALTAATFARAGSAAHVYAVGEAAAAFAMVAALFAGLIALLVLVVRLAALGVDDGGVSWGYPALSFLMPAARIRCCRVYRDSVAVEGRFTWYLCARDYGPFPDLVAALRRTRLPVVDNGGRTPFRARLQSYGTALDTLLVLDILASTALALYVRSQT